MPARYRAFIRVSDERQDHATQETAIAAHVAARGYVQAGEPYRMDGSAYHGRQVALLQQAIDGMLAGQYDVLVCSASSRLWRGRSAARAVVLIDEAEAQGARFEFCGEPHISTGGTPAEYIEMIRLQAFQVNRRESDMKSERSRNTHAMHKLTGAVSGREPYGTVITCDICGTVTTRLPDGSVTRCGHKHAKSYAPTDEARRVVPRVIAAAIAGQSTLAMTRWLAADTGRPWHETLAGRIIRRGAFYAALGLVSDSDAAAALAAYLGRGRGGRTATVHEPALVVPLCRCGAKMYRCYAGKDDRREAFYRCHAKCGVRMIRASELEPAVIAAVSGDQSPHFARAWVPGTGNADRAARLRAEAMKAYAAGDRQRFAALDGQAAALDGQPDTRPRWAYRMTCGCETVLDAGHSGHRPQSEGAWFASLGREAARDYLRSLTVTAERGEHGVVVAVTRDSAGRDAQDAGALVSSAFAMAVVQGAPAGAVPVGE